MEEWCQWESDTFKQATRCCTMEIKLTNYSTCSFGDQKETEHIEGQYAPIMATKIETIPDNNENIKTKISVTLKLAQQNMWPERLIMAHETRRPKTSRTFPPISSWTFDNTVTRNVPAQSINKTLVWHERANYWGDIGKIMEGYFDLKL